MVIRSKIHSIHYTRPISIWILINFIAACACSPGENHSHYNFEALFITIVITSVFIFIISSLIIFNMPTLTIVDDLIIYKNPFNTNRQEYNMNEIIDFDWSGAPVVVRSRYGPNPKLNNEMFILKFSNGKELSIEFSQYANFKEIRAFFYNYCVKHGIIHMRSLGDRKKSLTEQ